MRIPAWSRKLLVGIAFVVRIHAYGWGMHIVLERVTFTDRCGLRFASFQ